MSKATKIETETVESQVVMETAKMYNLDMSLISEEYFAPLDEALPYAISDSRGYIMIPGTEIEKSAWLSPPTNLTTVSIKGGEPFSALIMPKMRVSVLGKSLPYWYYSNSPANRTSKLAGQPVCWYNSPEGQNLKAEMEKAAQSSSGVRPYAYATKLQLFLLDEDMIPLHEIPLSCNFRGSACWHVLDELKKFYLSAEKVIAKVAGSRRTAFDERVRALFIPEIEFGTEWVGTEGQKSEAIRIKSITKPTTENLTEWYLGFKETAEIRNLIWDTQYNYKGCGASRLPEPASLNSEPVVQAIASSPNTLRLSPGVGANTEAAEAF